MYKSRFFSDPQRFCEEKRLRPLALAAVRGVVCPVAIPVASALAGLFFLYLRRERNLSRSAFAIVSAS